MAADRFPGRQGAQARYAGRISAVLPKHMTAMDDSVALTQGATRAGSPPHCPHCRGESLHFRRSGDINRGTTPDVFDYFRCQQCGLVFMSNIPSDLAPYYRGGYQTVPSSLAELRKLASKERYRLAEVLRVKRSGRLLEIGPWIGIFSANAKDAGFEVEAIESDASAVRFLRDVLGIQVFSSADPASTLEQLRDRYDAIVLWHSLEHLPTPWLVIERAAKALKPGGILLVALPDIDSYESRIMREQWVHLDAPRHLYFYSSSDLSALCERSGLVRLRIRVRDRLSLLLGAQAWYRYLRRCSPLQYMRALAGIGQGVGSGFTAVFQRKA